jgi:hypothetical protein
MRLQQFGGPSDEGAGIGDVFNQAHHGDHIIHILRETRSVDVRLKNPAWKSLVGDLDSFSLQFEPVYVRPIRSQYLQQFAREATHIQDSLTTLWGHNSGQRLMDTAIVGFIDARGMVIAALELGAVVSLDLIPGR